MSYTQEQFSTALQEMAVVQAGDPDFAAIVNSAIDYAEQRIYRELDFLATVARDKTLTLTPNVRELTINANTPFVTLQQVSMLGGASTADTTNSTRTPLTPVSRDLLDIVYGGPVPVGPPKWFAMLDNQTILVGPFPDQAYPIELVGTIRPAPLYSLTQPTMGTFISLNLPDLFMAAVMIFVSGYQKNFGSQADNPQMAVSWETIYSEAKASAQVEEARKKFESAGWTSRSAPEAATPSR